MLKNFTIILPGGCNANCSFCTDKGDITTVPNYLKKVREAIAFLPEGFNQVSITGGETSLSPYLKQVLSLISLSGKFERVVLTTNGTKILKVLDDILPHINHLNVSRHAVSDEDNCQIFGTNKVLAEAQYPTLVSKCNAKGVDVCMNVVYGKDSDWDYSSIHKLVTRFGVNKVAMRYDMSENDLSETYLEARLKNLPVVYSGGCPVCRSHTVMIAGTPITLKNSLEEPTSVLGENSGYEYILHEDGVLTEDWGKKIMVKVKTKPSKKIEMTEQELEDYVKKRIAKEMLASQVVMQPFPSVTRRKAAPRSFGCVSSGYGSRPCG